MPNQPHSTNPPRVLFLYPNSDGLGGIPNGIALLSACLKSEGIEVQCFDTTFYNEEPATHLQRAKHGYFKKADHKKAWGGYDTKLKSKVPQIFLQKIKEFKPHLIAISHVEISVGYMTNLLKQVRQKHNVPVVAGGITCTSSPELIIKNPDIDIVCVGEGERPLTELVQCIAKGKNYTRIPNLWVKHNGSVIKNPMRPLIDMNLLPPQDWDIFDTRHHYKPYCGKFRRTAFVEMARGCHYNCTYCVINALRTMYGNLGSFMRLRSIDKTMDEVQHLKNKYNIELIFFIDDNFLGMPMDRFRYFCEQYKKRINLPFYINTRAETIKEDRVKMLAEINISTIAIGLEHGNEEYRKKYMYRKATNKMMRQAFKIVKKYSIRTTANVIIGMPHETEAMMGDTIDMLKEIAPSSVSINYFAPYRGTIMRQMAIDEGIIDKDHIVTDTGKCLTKIAGFPPERIQHYYENLKRYVDGELEFKEDKTLEVCKTSKVC